MEFEKWYARIEPDLKSRIADGNKIAIETLHAIISKHYGGDPRTKRAAINRLRENGKLRPDPKSPKTTYIYLDGHDKKMETKEEVMAELKVMAGQGVI
jgi:DNA-binding transcriptional regulator PaaX